MAKLLAKTSGQGRDDDEKSIFAQVRLARLPAHARARRVADDTGLQVLGAIIFLLIFSFALSCIEQFAQAQQLEYDTEKLAPFKAKAVAAAEKKVWLTYTHTPVRTNHTYLHTPPPTQSTYPTSARLQ